MTILTLSWIRSISSIKILIYCASLLILIRLHLTYLHYVKIIFWNIIKSCHHRQFKIWNIFMDFWICTIWTQALWLPSKFKICFRVKMLTSCGNMKRLIICLIIRWANRHCFKMFIWRNLCIRNYFKMDWSPMTCMWIARRWT